MNKEFRRESNIELLRIISMMGIIGLHYFNKDLGNVAGCAEAFDFIWIVGKTLQSAAVPLVNIFVLITGYFLVNQKEQSFRKPAELLLITAWYGLLSYSISIFCGVNTFSLKGVFYAIFPFFEGRRWFVETYIILLLLVPFINKAIVSISQSAYRRLLGIQLVLFCLWYSVGLSAPLLDNGYGIINFITLYLIGAYLRRYGIPVWWPCASVGKGIVGYLICCIGTFCAGIFVNSFGYAFFTNIVAAVMLFIAALHLNLGENKIINQISSYAFDVYFVHSDINTGKLLFQTVLKSDRIGNTILVFPHLIVSLVLIYLLGMIAGWIRKKIWNKTIDKKLERSVFLNQKLEI